MFDGENAFFGYYNIDFFLKKPRVLPWAALISKPVS